MAIGIQGFLEELEEKIYIKANASSVNRVHGKTVVLDKRVLFRCDDQVAALLVFISFNL